MKSFKYEPIILIMAIILGFIASFFSVLSDIAAYVEEPFLIVLLVLIFTEIDFSQLKRAIHNLKFIITALIINFIWTPIFAVILSKTLLADSIDLQIALVLLLIMPCTDWYLIFTDMTGGNVALSSAILPFNLIFQLLLFPVILFTVFGSSNLGIGLEYKTDFEFAYSLIIALIISILLKQLTKRSSFGKRIDEFFENHGSKLEFVTITIIAFCIFASEGQGIFTMEITVVLLFVAMIVFYSINFLLALLVAKREKLSKADTVSLVFTTTSRNTPLSLSLASLIFTNKPLIAIALLLGPLTEIPISLTESFVLRGILKIDE